MPCLNCGTETDNPKFCNVSCSASYNNRQRPKTAIPRNKKAKCKKCGKSKNAQYDICQRCYRENRILEFGRKKIKEFRHTHDRHKHQNIRLHAHRVAKFFGVPKKCVICDYSVHVELAHLKPIYEFDQDTMLSIVNSLTNLRYLCRNHHWESEHDMLSEIDEARLRRGFVHRPSCVKIIKVGFEGDNGEII